MNLTALKDFRKINLNGNCEPLGKFTYQNRLYLICDNLTTGQHG